MINIVVGDKVLLSRAAFFLFKTVQEQVMSLFLSNNQRRAKWAIAYKELAGLRSQCKNG